MSGWEVRFSNSRKTPYFYNASTQQSTWEPPAGMSEAEIHSLPGAKYLTGGGDTGQVRASHILAKHAGSRRPSSWKQVSLIHHSITTTSFAHAHGARRLSHYGTGRRSNSSG